MITKKGALAVSSSERKSSATQKDISVGWQEKSTQQKKRKCRIQISYTSESFVVLSFSCEVLQPIKWYYVLNLFLYELLWYGTS